jgi:hypothetical protein
MIFFIFYIFINNFLASEILKKTYFHPFVQIETFLFYCLQKFIHLYSIVILDFQKWEFLRLQMAFDEMLGQCNQVLVFH